MFDEVVTGSVGCPLCGAELGWQTKDGGQALQQLTVHELMKFKNEVTFYADCDPCRAWVEVSVKVRPDQETSAQMVQRNVDELLIRRKGRQ